MNKKLVTLIAVVAVLTIAFAAATPVDVFGGNAKNKKPLSTMKQMKRAIIKLQNQMDEANEEIALLKTQAGNSDGVEVIVGEPNTDIIINNTQERYWLLVGSITGIQKANSNPCHLKIWFYIDDVMVDAGGEQYFTNVGEGNFLTYEYFHPVILPEGEHTVRFEISIPCPQDCQYCPPEEPATFERQNFVCIGFPGENE